MKSTTVDDFAVIPRFNQFIALAIGCLLVGSVWYRHAASAVELPAGPEATPAVAIEVSLCDEESEILFFISQPTLRNAVRSCGTGIDLDRYPQSDYSAGLSNGTHVVVFLDDGQISITCVPMAAEKRIVLGIPFDINTAGSDDLALISGVGPGLAEEIVSYREKIGGFAGIEQLRKVRGVGKKRFDRIKKYVSVSSER